METVIINVIVRGVIGIPVYGQVTVELPADYHIDELDQFVDVLGEACSEYEDSYDMCYSYEELDHSPTVDQIDDVVCVDEADVKFVRNSAGALVVAEEPASGQAAPEDDAE